MKTKRWNRLLAPLVFLFLYLLGNLVGAALYVVRFQIAHEGGRAPSELGGWLTTTVFCAVLAMLNLCGLNQVLFLGCCLWPKLRDRVGFMFALLSGVIFCFLPLTLMNALRFASGHSIGMMNSNPHEYAISWALCGIAFLGLAWMCTVFSARKRNKGIEQSPPPYGSPAAGSPSGEA